MKNKRLVLSLMMALVVLVSMACQHPILMAG